MPRRRPDPRQLAPIAVSAILLGLLIVGSANGLETRTEGFAPIADAYVTAAQPRTNFGRSPELRLAGRPKTRSFVTFDLRPLEDRAITSARLRLYVRDGLRRGFAVRTVSSAWKERGVTYENAPELGQELVRSGRLRARRWTTVDVTSLVEAGTLARLALTPVVRTSTRLSSRQSSLSPRLRVTSVRDTRPPSVVVTSPTTGSTYTAPERVQVRASAVDDVGVRHVEFYDNGVLKKRDKSAPYTYSWSLGPADNGAHSWTAKAYDRAGRTATSSAVSVDVAVGTVDTIPPTAPAGLTRTGATSTSVTLGWSAASDDVGVAGYRVFVDGAAHGTTALTSHTVTGLACGSSHAFAVEAFDAAGNVSNRATLTAATSACPSSSQPTFPIRAAFYYPWFPETWTVNGALTQFNPSLGLYASVDAAVQETHIAALRYARVDAAISSWWGPGHYTNARLQSLLDRTTSLGSPLRWAVYHEAEGQGDPSVGQIAADLASIRDNLATSSAYLRIDGKFVVFVYNASANDSSCAVADRWAQANAQLGGEAYVVLKVFSGFKLCASQPAGWHQYAPAKAADSQNGYSYAISPGFWRADEASPRLARDLTRWRANVRDMVASNAPWQLVTTFNEWGEGTSVESAQQWASSSGYGAYLDALRDHGEGGVDTTPPTAPSGFAVTGGTATSLTASWGASTDDTGVSGYRLSRDGVEVGTTEGTTYTFSGLSCGTSYSLSATAFDAAGNVSSPSTRVASTPACLPPSADPVIAAAGDIACDPASGSFNEGRGTSSTCRQMYVSDLLVGQDLAAVLTLGDNQYETGQLSAFQQSFHPSWGRVKPLIRPSVGNHEYQTAGAAGYFAYFGAAAGDPTTGYYSYDVGAWHLIALNSNCSQVGGCGSSSPQVAWLKQDLAAHANVCTLAYWHHPRFSSGEHGSSTAYTALWQALYDADADLVLNGHDHDYERFAPQRPDGTLDQVRGIREFVVGTGGKNHYATSNVQPNSEVRNSDTYGVLKLTLRSSGYDWEFVPEAGRSFADTGSGACH